jgi:hypothetical protein
MPDFVGELGQFDALQLFGARIIEETKFDFGGIGRKEGKVDALDIPCSSAGMRKALANLEAGRESKTRFFDFGASFYYVMSVSVCLSLDLWKNGAFSGTQEW